MRDKLLAHLNRFYIPGLLFYRKRSNKHFGRKSISIVCPSKQLKSNERNHVKDVSHLTSKSKYINTHLLLDNIPYHKTNRPENQNVTNKVYDKSVLFRTSLSLKYTKSLKKLLM